MQMCGYELFHFSTHAPDFQIEHWTAPLHWQLHSVRDLSTDLLAALTPTCTTRQLFISFRTFYVLCLIAYEASTDTYHVTGKNITSWVQQTTSSVFEQNVIAKKHFVSHIFHEIRNSLDVITLALDELRSTTKSDLLTTIDDNARLIADILDDVVTFDNFKTMHTSMQTKPFMLHDLFKKCVHTMNTYLNMNGLVFTYSNDLQSETIAGDYFKLKQVIVHFLSNAVKHARTHVQLEMKAVQVNAATQVCVQVEDDGPEVSSVLGLAAVENDAQVGMDAPGLALLIVKRIIQLHGGTIEVTRVMDTTRVAITFGHVECILPPSPTVPLLATNTSVPEPLQQSTRPAKKVLLVDDNQMIIKLMRNMVKRIGITDVEVAYNGEEAVQRYASALQQGEPFTHVLLDQEMPKMDGNVAAQHIKQMHAAAQIIGITGNSTERQHTAFLEHGADRVINKPITEHVVRRLLTQ